MKKLRTAAIVVLALGVLGVSVHAATDHAGAAQCFLCALCPF